MAPCRLVAFLQLLLVLFMQLLSPQPLTFHLLRPGGGAMPTHVARRTTRTGLSTCLSCHALRERLAYAGAAPWAFCRPLGGILTT